MSADVTGADAEEILTTSLTAQLPRVAGRSPRVAMLVFNNATSDSRVFKTAATLENAGAETLIIGFASRVELDTVPEGHGTVAGGLPVFRTTDVDLVRMLPRTARMWRKFRGKDLKTGQPLPRTGGSNSPTDARPPAAAPPSADGAPPVDTAFLSRARNLAIGTADKAYKVARLAKYWGASVEVARRFGPDVVHANDGNTLAPAMVIRLLTGARVVYDSHELWRRRNVRKRLIAPYVESLIEAVGIRAADAIITVSPSIAKWLKETYRLKDLPVLVRNVPLGTGDIPDRSAGRLRQMSGLGPDAKIISYTGGITTGRGLEETIDALVRLPDDVHLVLLGFGGPEYIASFQRYVERAGVADRVHMVGKVPSNEVAQTLADADVAVVYVRPIVLSYRYALPNKIFESVHAGLPIVAADLPDMAAMVEENGIGVVFGEGSPDDLARAISDVLAEPEKYRHHVRELAAKLDWRNEAERLIDAYRDALGRLARSSRSRSS